MIPCMCRCELGDDEDEEGAHSHAVEARAATAVKQRDRNYYTPLMCAVEAGNQKCVHELLSDVGESSTESSAADKREELHARDKDGNTVYHVAAEADNVDSLRYLLLHDESKDDVVFARNNLDDSILHVACRKGNLESVKLIANR